jgi:hypothetical protein
MPPGRVEPIKRAHSPEVLPDASASRAAGLASVYKISPIPCGAAELSRQGEHSLATGSFKRAAGGSKVKAQS